MRKYRSLLVLAAILGITLQILGTFDTVEGSIESWKGDVRLTFDDAVSYRPDISTDSLNNLHVVWTDGRTGYAEVFYKTYDGDNWVEDVRLDNDDNGGSRFPTITTDKNDNIHVAFADNRRIDNQEEIYYTTNDGGGWSTPLRVTVNSGYSVAWAPQLGPKIVANSQNHLYIFWSGYMNYNGNNDMDIFYVEYNGNIWSQIQDVTNDLRPGYDHFNPVVVIDSDDKIHIAYATTDPSGYYMIHYRQFDGTDWSIETRISDGENAVNYPSIAIDSMDNVHLIWADNRNSETVIAGEIYYSKLDSEGNTVIDDLRITNGYPDSSELNNIAADLNDNIHIIWERTEDENSDNKTIWYTKLSNNGVTLIEDIELSLSHTKDIFVLDTVHLAIDSQNRLHIVFQDDRDGNLEIYYKCSYVQELSINTTDIQFSNELPQSNENFYINATIHNTGEILTNGTVKFYKDSIEDINLIGSDTVSVPAGETENVSIQWNDVSGAYNIFIVIEPEIFIAEANITNNDANRTLIINDLPTISITNPNVDVTVDTSCTVSWVANDPDDDAMIRLYYDNDNTGNDGTLINTSDQYPSGIVDNNGASQSYDWDTSALPDDSNWYVYAKINDNIHTPVYSYSPGKIEIDHPNIPPTVEITSPTGGIVSGSITIQGTATDPDKGNIESVFVSIDNKVNWKLVTGTTSWNYNWDTTKYSNGAHTIYAKAYDGEDSSEIVSVTVTVDNGGNIAPQVSITHPSDDTTISGDVEIRGSASDTDGEVQVVEIRIDNEGWREVTGTSNWGYDWDTTAYTNGEHTIKARAKDDLGLYSQEKSIRIIVDNGGNILPSVQITSHSGSEVVSGETEIKGTAGDHDGNVESVEFRIDSGKWNTATGTNSWSYTWDTTTTTNGEHVLYVRAKDNSNEYSQIESVTLIVDNGGNIPPIIHILSPTGGTVSGEVTIRGSASDLDGDNTIEYVQIKIDEGDWEDADGISEWSYIWDTTTLDDGNYTISARAYDGIDYSKVKSVNVSIDNPYKPTLTITSEIPHEVSGTITIQGTASDVDGEITKVEIQIDDGEWEEMEGTTDWSYELDTTELENGEHTIRIRVYDDEGEYYEEAFSITVKNEEDILWVYLIIAIIVICIILGVAVWKMRGKSGIEPKSVQQMDQTQAQTVKCPQCNSVFEVAQGSETIKCPYCGLSGKSAT